MTDMTRKQKKGISIVLTTLIIVVASVVLGSAVTLFSTSLFQTGSQQQAINVSQVKLFNNGTDSIVGAAVVRNSGDKLLAVDTITIRGVLTPYSNIYYNTTGATTLNQQKQLEYDDANVLSGTGFTSSWDIDLDGNDDLIGNPSLSQATGPISLDPGKGVIMYFALPTGTITDADVGASVSVSIFAGQVGQVQTVSVGRAV